MKDIADMTPDELNALPVFSEFDSLQYKVTDDGTVTLPGGRVLRGLVGGYISVPTATNRSRAVFMYQENTPIMWRDARGDFWRPVLLTTGEWMRERA